MVPAPPEAGAKPRPIALLIELPVTQSTSMNITNGGPGADVFANGKLILPEGPHPSDTFKYQQISRFYNLNIPASETSLTLAVRTLYIPFRPYGLHQLLL